MPKHLTARPPVDAVEESKVRKLTHRMHAPADWIFHAKIIAHSWDGLRTRQIAEALSCHAQTVRERLQAFNERGFEGLGMKPGGGRKPRLTQQERSTILYLGPAPTSRKAHLRTHGRTVGARSEGRSGVDARCAHRHGVPEGHPGGPQPGPADLPPRRRALAAHAALDECAFWYTTEYVRSTSSFNWSTQTTSFKFTSS
jgi:hypothetical protein